MGKGKLVANVIERAPARYEVEEAEYGKVYKWQPETVVVECVCGEETTLTPSDTACEECGTEHKRLVRENLPDLQPQSDERVHPRALFGGRRSAAVLRKPSA
jgi:hypothetical protein